MAAQQLLRRVRSTTRANNGYGNSNSNKHAKPAVPAPTPTVDLSTAVESPLSLSTKQSLTPLRKTQRSDSTVSEFRRRLARKASIVSLRSRSKKGEKIRDGWSGLLKRVDSQYTLSENHLENSLSGFSTPSPVCQPVYELPGETRPTPENFLPRETQRIETGREVGLGSWVRMSADTITPPVPFLRLKEIASNACADALSSQSSYVHALTESWNTQIINTILSALVQETTPPSASQPQWKYVVNSTIIQHAASTSSGSAADDKKIPAGRRGMHSASGAYWNNEKDGMWSFKYEAAEAKGLDVVVGVIWIWVG